METSQKQVLFTECHPILNVKNVAASLDYYYNKLNFKKDFAWPPYCEAKGQTVPTFAQVSRGKFAVMLAEEAQGGPGMWIYLDVASLHDLEALYQEYLASGARITELPTDKPWNMREMLVEDLDGHTLRIGAPLHE